ncbi:MAG: aminotransferase class III-fold pyridoxal phosphate-dependent enzyme, partial [Chitinophagaceae bacterium]
ITALQVLQDEKMAENAAKMGDYFRGKLRELHSPYIEVVRGKGLLNAIVVRHEHKKAAWDICLALKEKGMLAKPTHEDKIRFAPPLIIRQDQLDECIVMIKESLTILEA